MHRSLKFLAAALLTATLLSGCSVFSARTIRAGIVGEPAGLELAYTDDASALVGSMVHAGLYRADATFAPTPVLADGEALSAAGGTVARHPALRAHLPRWIATDHRRCEVHL